MGKVGRHQPYRMEREKASKRSAQKETSIIGVVAMVFVVICSQSTNCIRVKQSEGGRTLEGCRVTETLGD
jgi:hypothetical protein